MSLFITSQAQYIRFPRTCRLPLGCVCPKIRIMRLLDILGQTQINDSSDISTESTLHSWHHRGSGGAILRWPIAFVGKEVSCDEGHVCMSRVARFGAGQIGQ
eukprot:800762-Amphidinium_carterae.1